MSLPGGSEQSAGNRAPQLGAGDPFGIREGQSANVVNCRGVCLALRFAQRQ